MSTLHNAPCDSLHPSGTACILLRHQPAIFKHRLNCLETQCQTKRSFVFNVHLLWERTRTRTLKTGPETPTHTFLVPLSLSSLVSHNRYPTHNPDFLPPHPQHVRCRDPPHHPSHRHPTHCVLCDPHSPITPPNPLAAIRCTTPVTPPKSPPVASIAVASSRMQGASSQGAT